MRKTRDYWETWVTVGEIELGGCRVFFDSSPPEPDVNFGGDLEVTSLEWRGRDVYHDMSPAEEEALLVRLEEHLSGEDDGYSDYLYEQRRDYELEQRATAQSLQNDNEDGRYK